MGSKKLKAVVAKGDLKVPVADPEATSKLRKEHIAAIRKQVLHELHIFGTTSHSAASAHSGDSPVKNWGGVGVRDIPDVSGLEKEIITAKVASRTGCWRCPIACRGKLKEGPSGYQYPAETRRPEYETTAAFGSMCLNSNMDAIAMANHICNSYGLDTISTGTTIAFALECLNMDLLTLRI
jgi:aldehyde:ferredoxin oxidoreductase